MAAMILYCISLIIRFKLSQCLPWEPYCMGMIIYNYNVVTAHGLIMVPVMPVLIRGFDN